LFRSDHLFEDFASKLGSDEGLMIGIVVFQHSMMHEGEGLLTSAIGAMRGSADVPRTADS